MRLGLAALALAAGACRAPADPTVAGSEPVGAGAAATDSPVVPAPPPSPSTSAGPSAADASTPHAAQPDPGPSRDLEVEVRGLETDDAESPVLLLGPADGSLLLPIRVGPAEALSIAYALAKHTSARPLTHDLFGNLLEAAEATLERVTVTEVRDDTFFARMSLLVGKRKVDLDSRPSDAVAIAMRMKVPIFVSHQVLGVAGIRRPDPEARRGRQARALGMAVQPLTATIAERLGLERTTGALVADVERGGLAAAAGLRPGDRLDSIDGQELADVEDFVRAAAAAKDIVAVEYQRGREHRRTRLGAR